MAAKSKAKSKAKATKSRKAAPRKRKPQQPAVEVPNSTFAPGTTVGFHLAEEVTVERGLGREPFGDPITTAKVAKSGKLEVRGLPKGVYCAVGPVGDTYRYVGFSVK
jgi:hypothetical protein